MTPSFHTTARRVIQWWLAFVAVFTSALLLFPNKGVQPSLFVTIITQALLFLTTVAIIRHETNSKNKFVFANFSVLFFLSVAGALGPFVGKGATFFADPPRAAHYFGVYLTGSYGLFLALAIVYLAVDALFRDFKTLHKYVVTLAVVGGFFGSYFGGFLANPDYAYTTQDILDWKTMDNAVQAYSEAHGTVPDPAQLAASTEMYVYRGASPVATLHPDERVARITELYPYLEGANVGILLWKPVSYYMVFMSVLAIGFILLFFGYQYMKDPPQGAYIEKMMFMFLLFCSMEVLHHWSAVKALEWTTFAEIVGVGQYASVGVLLLIAVFFALRLRFIMSVKGEFYEQELASRPAGITRWRDALDTIVVENFFNRKIVHGRLFALIGRAQNGHKD